MLPTRESERSNVLSLARIGRAPRGALAAGKQEDQKNYAAPRLVRVDWLKQYSIVFWKDRYFGVPKRIGSVDLETTNLADVDGLVEAETYQQLQELLNQLPPDNGSPVLIETLGTFNIVVWRGRFYGIDRSLGAFDLQAGERPEKGLLVGDTLEELRSAIPREVRVAPPRMLEEYGSYNIVGWNGRFFAVPKALGAVDVTKPDSASILDVLQTATIDDIRLKIQQRIWSF